MRENRSKNTVVVRATQPLTAKGLRTLMSTIGDLGLLVSLNSMAATMQMLSAEPPDVVIVQNGLGARSLAGWIYHSIPADVHPYVRKWDLAPTKAEMRAGAKGIVRRTAGVES